MSQDDAVPRAPIRTIAAGTIAALALAACGSEAPPDRRDPTGASTLDPALADALADPILVDPDLGQQANGDALRPPDRPLSGGLPPADIAPIAPDAAPSFHAPEPGGDCAECAIAREARTLGALAAVQRDPRTRACAATLRYSARWAARMPAALPLPRDARVLVAAGTDEGQCALRAARFVTAMPIKSAIDFYYAHASASGFSADHRAADDMNTLHGTRGRDAAAYAVIARPRADGGSVIDLVVNAAG